MNTANASPLPCRHCRHYNHEGRRGGHCQRLGVPVRGEWKPCPLMIPSFASPREALEEVLPLHAHGSVAYLRDAIPQRQISITASALSKSA